MSKNIIGTIDKKDVIDNSAIRKGAEVKGLIISDDELATINKFTLDDLVESDVFVFKAVITENTTDREFEYISRETIFEMADSFIGKPLIKDHAWKADNQIGRIYKTEIIESGQMTDHGEQLTKLIAYAYILRSDKNADLIAEINAGIVREVSIGFSIKSVICGVCGTDNAVKYCEHWWGKTYDGVVAVFKLHGLVDTYELSLVAVPAMAGAGAVKRLGAKGIDIEEVETEIDESIPSDDEKTKELLLELELAELDTFINVNK